MREVIDQEGELGELIAKAIEHVIVAQNCDAWSILEPGAARGLGKAARFHRQKSASLLNEVATQGRDAGHAATPSSWGKFNIANGP